MVDTYAAAWALGWLNNDQLEDNAWRPSSTEMESIISFVADLNSDTGAVRFLTWILARESDTRAVEPLIARLEDEDSDIRKAALEALGEIGDERAVEALVAMLEDEDSDVQRATAVALGQIGDKRAVEPLIARLEDEDSVIREAALGALGEIGDERAVEALVAVLEDEDSDVRYAAMGALGKIGDARAVEPLVARLADEDSNVQYAAMGALGKIGDARAVEPLVARLEDEDSDVREAALGALLPTCRDEINRKILTRDLDSVEPFLDPQEEISEEWVRHAAEGLRISVEEVRQRYEALAQQFRLRLAWQPRAEQSTHSSGSEGKNI